MTSFAYLAVIVTLLIMITDSTEEHRFRDQPQPTTMLAVLWVSAIAFALWRI